MTEIIERVVTHGTFSLDGGTWEVDNNVWIIGDDQRVTIIDPAHDVDKIAKRLPGARSRGFYLPTLTMIIFAPRKKPPSVLKHLST